MVTVRAVAIGRGHYNMLNYCILLALLVPAAGALLTLFTCRYHVIRSFIIFTGAVTVASVIGITWFVIHSGGMIKIRADSMIFDFNWIVKLVTLAVIIYIFYIGIRWKRFSVYMLAAAQLIPLILIDIFLKYRLPIYAFKIDRLSVIMLLITSVLGYTILFVSSGYIKKYYHNFYKEKNGQVITICLSMIQISVTNAFVISNNLQVYYLLWQILTVTSFFMLFQKKSRIAKNNAFRLLWMHLLSGLAFVFALIIVYEVKGTSGVDDITQLYVTGGYNKILIQALCLLCFAGIIRTAQFPFNSWLSSLDNVPAHIPAMLVSGTCIQSGIYLLLKFSPMLSNTIPGKLLSAAGAFTFTAAALMAILQNNMLKMTAYLSSSFTGFIICCTGFGNSTGYDAAILLTLFSSIIMALLYLCLECIDNETSSVSIRGLQGLIVKMPVVAAVMTSSLLLMSVPPFGMFLVGWLAFNSCMEVIPVIFLIIPGMLLILTLWIKLIGISLKCPEDDKTLKIKIPYYSVLALVFILVVVMAVNFTTVPLLKVFIRPFTDTFSLYDKNYYSFDNLKLWFRGSGMNLQGSIPYLFMFLIIFISLIFVFELFKNILEMRKSRMLKFNIQGGNLTNNLSISKSNVDTNKKYYTSGNSYIDYKPIIDEDKLSVLFNIVSIAFILVLFGVVYK